MAPAQVPARYLIWAALVAVAITTASLFVAALPRSDSARTVSDAFWTSLAIRGSEIEHYYSLESMAAAADAVVDGQIVSAAPGRVFGDEVDAVHYAALAVRISHVYSGSPLLTDDSSFTLEVIVPDATSVQAIAAELPSEPTIFFLRNKGLEAKRLGADMSVIASESAYYRLVMATGFLRIFDETISAPPGAEDEFLMNLNGANVDTVIRTIALTTTYN